MSPKHLRVNTTCGVVLAGGRSRRMGSNKAFLRFGKKTLIERVTGALAAVFTEVIIVVDDPESDERYAALPFSVVPDRVKNKGPMGGLETALRVIRQKSIFVVAADMPFLNPEVIRAMLDNGAQYDLVIPDLAGRLHPLHALYTQNCRPVIEAALKANRLALHLLKDEVCSRCFPETVFRKYDPALRSVLNINTPQDLSEARLFLKDDDESFTPNNY
ncbi:MAG: molybdenum cofactor guanylyltransferase [Nitrospiria bacterium]